MRIARALALSGIDSRRKCEAYILRGDVTLNGVVIKDLGRQVDPETDEILFRGRAIQWESRVYYAINKPKGYTTTALDPYAKKTVYDLLPAKLVPKTGKPMPARTRVFPVGRLDKDSSGILLFTNDGDMANRLTHPRYGIGKWYQVKLDRSLDPRDGGRLLKGVELEDGKAAAERLHSLSKRNHRVLIREGRNREIRRMFEALGYEVIELCRIAFGPIMLGEMSLGSGRFLSKKEIAMLKDVVYKEKKPAEPAESADDLSEESPED